MAVFTMRYSVVLMPFLALVGLYACHEGGVVSEKKPQQTTMQQPESFWKERLTPEQYKVLRERGTERAFTGKFYDHQAAGVYTCAACGQVLFDSDTKFDSGTGWPSFSDVAKNDRVTLVDDQSHGMRRVEVRCSRCGSHLGHLFNDGPSATGQRYCINSMALEFTPVEESKESTEPQQ